MVGPDSGDEFEFQQMIPSQMSQNMQRGNTLSVNNPVSDEVEVFLNQEHDMIEADEKLYGMVDNSIVSLSSINEFDGKKDWLAQQIDCGEDDEMSDRSAQT